MVIRVTGIVRIARDVQRRLQSGIPAEERASFLDTVAGHVRAIRLICEDEGAVPEDLPAPSRRAYGVLERVLATPPGDLPTGSTAGESTAGGTAAPGAPTTVRISGLLRVLDVLTARLGSRSQGTEGIEEVASRARAHVQRVRALCEQQGASPAALPTPSGQAFGMLAWLSTSAHAERYAAQHDLAKARLEPVVCAGVRDPLLHLTFAPGRTIHALRRRGRLTRLKLSVGYLAASAADFGDLAQTYAQRAYAQRGYAQRDSSLAEMPPEDMPPEDMPPEDMPPEDMPPEALRRYRAFHASEVSTAIICAIEDLWRGTTGHARGHAYDLDALFDRLNARYFEGKLKKFRIKTVLHGTEFQLQVWTALRSIPYGTTTTYKAIAEDIGNPDATRAAGGAIGKNPLPVIIPCHRVIGVDGSLVGFEGGIERKKILLRLEGALLV